MIGKLISALAGVANPTHEQWFVDFVTGGRQTSSGERINEQTALTCNAVLACNRILSETVASLPLDVYQRLPGGDKLPATDHPVHRLLHTEPNDDTSSFNFRETLQGHLGTWGNGYSEIMRAFDGTPLALWQRSPKPHHTKPVRRDDVDGKMWYQCRDDAGHETWVKSRDMLHIPGFGFDGIIGYSPISLMKESIGLNKGAERYAAELFANDARPNGVVSLEGELSEEAYERTKKAFNETGSEHGSRHKIQLLEGGATYAASQMNPKDVQMIEARRFGIEEVARAYRISLHLLQEFTEGAASYASIVELGREFIVFTMMPWLKRWEAEINRKLLDDGYFAEFNVAAFLRGDPAARSAYYKDLFMVGGVTVNRILQLENENPIGPAGDVRFVPMNMQTLEKAIKEPEPPEPKAPPAIPAPEDDGADESEENQRANPLTVMHARFDRAEAKSDERHCENMVAAAAMRSLLMDGSAFTGRRCDAIEEQIRKADENGSEWAASTCLRLDGLAIGSKQLAEHIQKMMQCLDEREKFGQMAHEIAERQLWTKEGKAAIRQAEAGGNFLAWMNTFYDSHLALCAEKFTLAAAMLGVPAGSLAQTHVEESRKLLLTATECGRDELIESVTACVAKWGQREPEAGGTTDGKADES